MQWRKSSFTETGNCVEVRQDHRSVRDSKNPTVELSVDRTAWQAFVRAATR